jgi:hypothetical protein
MSAGVQNPEVIDLVAQDADGEYMVIMIETRPWGTISDQPGQLKRKINTYAAYVLDGTLASQYPETVDQPVRIQLNCPEPPAAEIAVIIDWAKRRLREYGIPFAVYSRG